MRAPLKLNSIEQEHLQELYDAAGVARDELPYSPQFEEIWQGFQDRTFKNAEREQVFGAILKYVRSSSNAASGTAVETQLSDDQLKQLKLLLPRHAKGGKILPYSDEFNAARTEFNKLAGTDLNEHDFWRSILRSQGARRRPPAKRTKVAAAAREEEDDGE